MQTEIPRLLHHTNRAAPISTKVDFSPSHELIPIDTIELNILVIRILCIALCQNRIRIHTRKWIETTSERDPSSAAILDPI